jgi:uroporphyrinogen decarboxylase
VIAFVRGAGPHLCELTERLRADAFGLDTAMDPRWAFRQSSRSVAFQGNLDPLALVAGGEALDSGVDSILGSFRSRPHIFNLGHGILPETPLDNVARLIARVRSGAH